MKLRKTAVNIMVALTVWAQTSASVMSTSANSVFLNPPSQTGSTLPPISLSAVFDASLVNSPRAATIRTQLGITKALYAQALVLPNPSVFVLNDTAELTHQVGGSIPIELPWKLAFRLLSAKAQIKQTDLEVQRNLWLLRATVRRAYLDVVMATETTKAFDELRSLAGEVLSTAQKRFAADDVAALDVKRAELAMFQAEADVKQSNRRLLQAKERLSVLMGRDYHDTIEVPRLPTVRLKAETHELLPNFDEQLPILDSVIKEALQSRLDVKIIQQSIAVNNANMRIAKGNIIPNPHLNVGYSYSGNPPTGPGTHATRGYYVAVTQEVPMFNLQQGERARLHAQSIQLTRELESTKNVMTEEVIASYQQMVAARERIGYFQDKILPSSNTVAHMARRAYEVGQSDITSTLAAQQANVQTKVAYFEAVRTYQQTLTDLEQSIGHPL